MHTTRFWNNIYQVALNSRKIGKRNY